MTTILSVVSMVKQVKVTGSHVRCKSGNISETVQYTGVVIRTHH